MNWATEFNDFTMVQKVAMKIGILLIAKKQTLQPRMTGNEVGD